MPARKPTSGPELIKRLWEQTVRTEGGCWRWRGATTRGYGIIRIAGIMRTVHRIAYVELVGPIPDGLNLDHLCRVRRCWNPAHLEPVTNRENTARGFASRFALLKAAIQDQVLP